MSGESRHPGDTSDDHLIRAALDDVMTPGRPPPGPPAGMPDHIGHYRILNVLGEGGMGTVYAAEQTDPFRRRVAVKVVRRGLTSPELVARFQAERQALAMMDHPNVARVYDGGVTDADQPYFVMEHVVGSRITDFCDQHQLGADDRLTLFASVCDAIQHAHEKSLVHRDIKPSNILVAMSDGAPVPKVIDFGVAKAIGDPLTDATAATMYGQLVGTPEYMSPEQAAMDGTAIDTRSDVYSLGVLLYELLVGTRPFSSDAGLDSIRRTILEDEPSKPSTRVGDLDRADAVRIALDRHSTPAAIARRLRGDLDWITMKAMEKDRTRRYASASELAGDIRRHLHHEPIIAGPPSAGYRLLKLARRHRTGAIAAAIVAVAMIAGLVMMAIGLNEATTARASETAQRVLVKDLLDFVDASVRAVGADTMTGSMSDSPFGPVLDNQERRAELDALVALINPTVPQPDVEAFLRHICGNAYFNLGAFQAARTQLQNAYELRSTLLGPDHADTLDSMYGWTQAALRLGDGLALTRLEELRERCIDRYGPHGPITLHVSHNLALAYRNEDRLDDAETLYEDVLAHRTTTLGADHADTLVTLNNLAGLAYAQGRLEDAAKMHRDVRDRRAASLGRWHRQTLISQNNLGGTMCKLGEFEAALPLLEEVADAVVMMTPDSDLFRAVNTWYVGDCLLGLERLDDAEHALLAAHGVIEPTRGEQNSWTLEIVDLLICLHEQRADDAGADIWRQRQPDDHVQRWPCPGHRSSSEGNDQ